MWIDASESCFHEAMYDNFVVMEFHTKIILHPTDFSDNAAKALHVAADLLNIPKTRLVILHVINIPENTEHFSTDELEKMKADKTSEASEKMEQYLRNSFGGNSPIPVPEKIIRLHSTVYKDIIDYIIKIDPYMLVVGQKGNAKNKHVMLGSTTQHLLEKSTCPVLVVPSKMEE
jgi:nucleotide-binding universal stress UspA family protein